MEDISPGAGVRKSERQEEKAGDNTRALTMDDEMGWGGGGEGGCPGHHYDNNSTLLSSRQPTGKNLQWQPLSQSGH